MLEAQVFKLHFQAVDAETVRNRCVDIECFTRDTSLLVGRHRAQRLHVVQTVGELHENDANVFDHREHHLTKAFSLRFGTTAEFYLVQLADTVDKQSDFAAESLGDIIK